MMRHLAVALACLSFLIWPFAARPQSIAMPVSRLSDQIFVSGKEVSFEHLGSSRGVG